jgi:hypothetical protein
MKGRFKLAWQRAHTATFAEVAVSCRWDEGHDCRVQVAAGVAPGWATGAEFGAQVFFESLAGTKRAGGLVVDVEEVIGMVLDTTVKAVAFATFRALCAATGMNDRGAFTFDEQGGRFVLKAGDLEGAGAGRP